MWDTQKERETVCPVQIGHQKAAAAQARSVTTMMRPMPSVRICHAGTIVHFAKEAHGLRRPASRGIPPLDHFGMEAPDDVEGPGYPVSSS